MPDKNGLYEHLDGAAAPVLREYLRDSGHRWKAEALYEFAAEIGRLGELNLLWTRLEEQYREERRREKAGW
jgi:hypothetical protein